MIKQIFSILSSKEKKYFLLILAMVIVMATLDMIGIASIMPFVSVLLDPSLINTNEILYNFYKISKSLGIKNENEFIFTLGLIIFFLILFSILFRALTNYVQIFFNAKCQYNLANRIMEKYLNQTYDWILNRHSSELSKNILSDVHSVIARGLGSLLTLISNFTLMLVLIALLLFINYEVTIYAIGLIAILYLLIYKHTKDYIKKLGQKRFDANELCFKTIDETFSAFKEIKVSGLEKIFIKYFNKPTYTYTHSSALIDFLGKIPRMIVELLIFGGIILVLLYLILKQTSLVTVLPTVTVFAFAVYRLIPAMQTSFYSLSQLIFVTPIIKNMFNELKNLNDYKSNNNQNILSFKKEISLNSIYYNYPGASNESLKNIDLIIKPNTIVGFIGATGSGKTTLVDIILGLLEPTNGELKVDGKTINKINFRSWQKNIGYVPQVLHLADKTIIENIAFGVDPKNINFENVILASKVANLHDFVMNKLPLKYDTKVGESGIKFSGGQRQRIGIARAMYNKPKLLIMDEATSALDNSTEQSVINEITSLKNSTTIIMIAHRLISLKKCDIIYSLENGSLKKKGKYNEIISDQGELK